MTKKKELMFLLLIIAVASFFRLWQLGLIPPGLHPDQAANGLDALLILGGQHSPFFERGQGREALYLYLLAGSIGLFGIGIWQTHLVSALIGILTVIFTWFLAKKLFNTRVAFFTSFFLASSAWHITLSRTGFRAILIPLLSTLFFYFTYLTLKETSKKKRIIFAVLSGISFGLGFYTYISFRMMPAIVGFLMVVLLLTNRRIYKYFWKEIIISFFSAILTLLPLIIYFINHPASFVGRSGAVSIFNPDLNQGNLIGTFWEVLKKTFWMFFTDGDLNWRHNVSGFSVLDPLVSSLFLMGFFISLLIIIQRFTPLEVIGQGEKNKTHKSLTGFIKIKSLENKSPNDYLKYLLLIILFLGMLVPEVLSVEGIPHGLRAIGVIPAVFFFPAITINFLWERINHFLKNRNNKIFLGLILGIALIISLFYNYNLYFGISANSPGFYYAYRGDLTAVSNYLNERNLKEKTYLALDDYSVQTVEFLTAENNQPYILVNPDNSYQIKLNPGDQIIFAQETIYDLTKQAKIFDTKKFEEYHPEVKLIKRKFNQFGEEIIKIYEY